MKIIGYYNCLRSPEFANVNQLLSHITEPLIDFGKVTTSKQKPTLPKFYLNRKCKENV